MLEGDSLSTYFRMAVKARKEQLIRKLLKLDPQELSEEGLKKMLLSDLEKEYKEQLNQKKSGRK